MNWAWPIWGRTRKAPSRRELVRVLGLIEGLPERCRQVFELRKVHGLSQAETAKALRISENIVEKETAKGLNLILRHMAEAGSGVVTALKANAVHKRIYVAD